MKILNLKQVRELTSLSASTLWRLERTGRFPSRRQISANRVGWIFDEVEKFLAERVRGKVAPQVESKK